MAAISTALAADWLPVLPLAAAEIVLALAFSYCSL